VLAGRNDVDSSDLEVATRALNFSKTADRTAPPPLSDHHRDLTPLWSGLLRGRALPWETCRWQEEFPPAADTRLT
jgi:hypothetical protein